MGILNNFEGKVLEELELPGNMAFSTYTDPQFLPLAVSKGEAHLGKYFTLYSPHTNVFFWVFLIHFMWLLENSRWLLAHEVT